jgi:hypothetical protein
MYQFSRSIYRAVAPLVLEDGTAAVGERRQCVRDACEGTILRMAQDHRYFSQPSRFLFQEIRRHFALGDQPFVYRLIDLHVQMARDFLADQPFPTDPFGEVRRCPAFTRKGTSCRREPLAGREYCPSHKHLESELIAA